MPTRTGLSGLVAGLQDERPPAYRAIGFVYVLTISPRPFVDDNSQPNEEAAQFTFATCEKGIKCLRCLKTLKSAPGGPFGIV